MMICSLSKRGLKTKLGLIMPRFFVIRTFFERHVIDVILKECYT